MVSQKSDNPSSKRAKVEPMPEKGPAYSSMSGSDSEDSHKGDDSSHSSQQLVASIKATEILVSVILKHDGILSFSINSKQRSDTEISGGGEGDHVTAYTGIIQALISLTDTISIRDATDSINKFGLLILKNDSLEKFKSIQSQVSELLTHEERLDVKEALTQHLPALMEKANAQLKMGKIMQLGSHLSSLASCFLTEIQKDEQTTCYSRGRIDKNPDEGNIVKRASYALLAADRLCKLCKLEGETFKNELESFKSGLATKSKDSNSEGDEDHTIKYGITKLAGMDKGGCAATLLNNLEAVQEETAQKGLLTQARTDLLADNGGFAELIADLFDYQKEIKFDLDKAAPLTKNQLKNCSDEEQEALRLRLMEDIFISKKYIIKAPTTEEYEDKKTQQPKARRVINITRINEGDLVEILFKHLQITKSSFPNLCDYLSEQTLSRSSASAVEAKTKFDEIVDLFLEKEVIGKNGWHSTKKHPDGLTAEYLKAAITSKQIQKQESNQFSKASDIISR